MSIHKEFYGKSLDEAIEEACKYFNVPREKLEVEIVNDAKSGIFGLVGARKACVKAALISMDNSVINSDKDKKEETVKNKTTPKKNKTTTNKPNKKEEHKVEEAKNIKKETNNSEKDNELEKKRGTNSKKNMETSSNSELLSPMETPDSEEEEISLALDVCNVDDVLCVVNETLEKLISPIAPEATYELTVAESWIRVIIDCEDSAGILVGKDGNTLASIKYLASRIAGKKLGAALRLQLDVGNYREKQEERLKELALMLAEKVKSSGRSQSTRSMSSYQRRVIHLALEDDPMLVTHSKGEGSQRRVVIQLRKAPKERNKEKNIEVEE